MVIASNVKCGRKKKQNSFLINGTLFIQNYALFLETNTIFPVSKIHPKSLLGMIY